MPEGKILPEDEVVAVKGSGGVILAAGPEESRHFRYAPNCDRRD
jgi:hypothetical protein